MSLKPDQSRIRKQNWPLSGQHKSVCALTLLNFFIEEISLWGYSCFLHNFKMLGNIDIHIPQHIRRNKTLIRK